ncbi:1569_t:CDS:2, partial [Racocetra persica]
IKYLQKGENTVTNIGDITHWGVFELDSKERAIEVDRNISKEGLFE